MGCGHPLRPDAQVPRSQSMMLTLVFAVTCWLAVGTTIRWLTG